MIDLKTSGLIRIYFCFRWESLVLKISICLVNSFEPFSKQLNCVSHISVLVTPFAPHGPVVNCVCILGKLCHISWI